MPTWLLIAIILIVSCAGTAYITELYCNKVFESEWQEITYTGSSVEPKEVYICKRCNHQALINYHYCSNCGALMKNGKSRERFPDKIELSE